MRKKPNMAVFSVNTCLTQLTSLLSLLTFVTGVSGCGSSKQDATVL